MFVLLRRMVDNIANSDDVRALRRYPTLRREIVTAAYRALERFKEETRKMVRCGGAAALWGICVVLGGRVRWGARWWCCCCCWWGGVAVWRPGVCVRVSCGGAVGTGAAAWGGRGAAGCNC